MWCVLLCVWVFWAVTKFLPVLGNRVRCFQPCLFSSWGCNETRAFVPLWDPEPLFGVPFCLVLTTPPPILWLAVSFALSSASLTFSSSRLVSCSVYSLNFLFQDRILSSLISTWLNIFISLLIVSVFQMCFKYVYNCLLKCFYDSSFKCFVKRSGR